MGNTSSPTSTTAIDPRPRKAMAVFDHRYMSDPDKNWRGGEYQKRQKGRLGSGTTS